MSFFLKSKKLDFSTGRTPVAVIRQHEAENYGINSGDKLEIKWDSGEKIVVDAQFTNSKVEAGTIGFFKEVWKSKKFNSNEIAEINIVSRPMSIMAIRKMINGGKVNEDEIRSIIKDIVNGKLGDIESTYFAAAGFFKKYSIQELYYLTKAIAETGEMMNLPQKVVDKHCIGGIPGNRTTMLVIPIIASLGLYIPKTSSRAISSPAGTADTMEVLAPVSFNMKQIREIIRKTRACLVWGGGLSLAPADDKIIHVTHPLGIEAKEQFIISIMAKKVAMGVDHLLVDIPYGPTAKIQDIREVNRVGKLFVAVGKRFKMKVKVVGTKALGPIGEGVGPALEARDVLRVLQQKELRPRDLEQKACYLAGELLELKGFCPNGQGRKIAAEQIRSGAAWKQMQKIIKAQGGNHKIDSDEVALGAKRYEIHAEKNGRIVEVDNKAISVICRNLGAPQEKLSGIHLHAKYGQKVKEGEKLFTIYSVSDDRITLARRALKKIKIFIIK